MTAKVSIGIPVERYLERALEALLAQTYTDIELIISDNGSTDRIWEICNTYMARVQRIKLYRHEINEGARKNFPRIPFSEEAIAQTLTAPHESLRS
jgi:glycosyltransferase involved in cell wall biosynthesis